MYCKLASLMLNSAQTDGPTSEIFIAQPDANKEALAGKMFVLIEIGSNKSAALKIINFLINTLNHNYYQNEKIILRERIRTLKVEHIFEASLAKTNREMAEFLAKEKIKVSPRDFNITVGIVYENELHFSSVGKNRALLLYKHREETRTISPRMKNTDKNLTEIKYRIVDIGQGNKHSPPASPNQTANSNNKKNPPRTVAATKIFSNVISGPIPAGGYFLITNETLPEYFSNRQLIDIITKLPPAGAMEQIKNILSNINVYVSFLGILVKNTCGQKLSSPEDREEIPEVSAQNSISQLNRTEEKTEKLLTPSGIINFKKWLQVPKQIFSNVKLTHRAEGGRNMFIKDRIIFKKRQTWLVGKRIFLLLRDMAAHLVNFIFYCFKICSDRNKAKELVAENQKKIEIGREKITQKIKRIWQWFSNLNKKNKIFLAVAGACLFFLALNLFYTGLKNKKEAEQNVLNDLKELVEQRQNQIEAHLLYNNEDGAKKILDELAELLKKLPQDTPEQKEYYDTITAKYTQQLEKIRHIVKIENSNELADFSNLNNQAEVANILLANNKIYSGDGQQKTIYTINLSDNLITAIADLNQPIKVLNYPVLDKNENIYYFNEDSIIQLNTKTDEITNLSIDLPVEKQSIVAATGYNNKFYLLSKQDSQIYRFSKAERALTNRERWIKDKTNFSNPTSFSIDGQVYVLEANGQIFKYLKGEKQNFKLEEIDPPLAKATKIIVSQNLEFIYILEPANKRLIIFDKTGDFLSQYQFKKLDDLKDFVVDEKTKKIYLLNKTSIYMVEATHLQK